MNPRLLLLALISISFFSGTTSATTRASGLVAQILEPTNDVKLRGTRVQDVRIRVNGIVTTNLAWSLMLQRTEGGKPIVAATGSSTVQDEVVAQLRTDDIDIGTYRLSLAVDDGQQTATAEVNIRVVHSAYTVIPLDEGNLSRITPQLYTSDRSGNLLVYAGRNTDPAELHLFERSLRRKRMILVSIGSTDSFRLSGDGARLFSTSHFPGELGFPEFGLGFLDLSSGTRSLVDTDGNPFFATDFPGRRVVYHGATGDRAYQYFLKDLDSGDRRQLTDDPAAIDRRGIAGCPLLSGSRPLISADGGRVVVATAATLGMAPADPDVGCRIFTYHVGDGSWAHVASLPKSTTFGSSTLSDDGRWLSFATSRSLPNGTVRSFPALVDLSTGEVRDPVVEVGDFTSFDSVVTGDGSGMVISTQADLDPLVGNADHNLELFYYDFATARFSQISETTGGIGSRPGGCPPYRPLSSVDGSVAMFFFHRFSVEGCALDGPMRNEADGFLFRFVHAVRKRPGNGAPILAPMPDRHVVPGETLRLDIQAHDPDDDFISFFAQEKGRDDVPPGSVIIDHHDGTATFEWATRPEHAGTYVLRVAAFDEGGGEMFQDVTITVAGRDRTETVVPSPTASPTPQPAACPGDCDGSDDVTIAELITGTRIALGAASPSDCGQFACYTGTEGSIVCLTRAVLSALNGC